MQAPLRQPRREQHTPSQHTWPSSHAPPHDAPRVQVPSSQRSAPWQRFSHSPQWKRSVVVSTHPTSGSSTQQVDSGVPSHGSRDPHTQRPPSQRSAVRMSHAASQSPQSSADVARFAQ